MDLSELARALRDTAQSASNAVASNVSGPVDLIAAALRKAGVPVPQDAVGGSEWMARKGLTREVPMGAPRLVGETLGLAGPIAVQAKAPQIAAAANKMVDNALAPRQMNPQAGAIVWHGSPHRFTKFDSSKIGTGEGAQAYGHGIYTAEARDVAKSYADELGDLEILHNGKVVGVFDKDPAANAAHQIRATGGDVQKAIQRAKNLYTGSWQQKVIGEINRLGAGDVSERVAGNLYKIDLPDEQIARMLDWDRPFSQQATDVRKALQDVGVVGKDDWLISGMRGREIYNRAAMGAPSKLPLNQADDQIYSAERLRAAGIPGIRYLDQGSRGAGQGTSNFVVFPGNEDMLKILEINGQPVQAVIDALRNNR
jgi:hypothetical protein